MPLLKKSRSPRRRKPSTVLKSPQRIVYQPKYRFRRSRSASPKRRKRKSLR